MVSIYATLIINGRRTFDSVPKKLQAKVEAELKNRGYGTDGQPLPVEKKQKKLDLSSNTYFITVTNN